MSGWRQPDSEPRIRAALMVLVVIASVVVGFILFVFVYNMIMYGGINS
jgi:hypothetical protein